MSVVALGVYGISRNFKKVGSRFILPWFGLYSFLNYFDEKRFNMQNFELNKNIGERFGTMMTLEGDHNWKLEK